MRFKKKQLMECAYLNDFEIYESAAIHPDATSGLERFISIMFFFCLNCLIVFLFLLFILL